MCSVLCWYNLENLYTIYMIKAVVVLLQMIRQQFSISLSRTCHKATAIFGIVANSSHDVCTIHKPVKYAEPA